MMNKAPQDWLKELSEFLTADAWDTNRIQELLTNVWADGYNEGANA